MIKARLRTESFQGLFVCVHHYNTLLAQYHSLSTSSPAASPAAVSSVSRNEQEPIAEVEVMPRDDSCTFAYRFDSGADVRSPMQVCFTLC